MTANANPKVAVVGAGISGISAARKLLKHGLTNVKVFEASKSIGGRIRTHYFKGLEDEGTLPYKLELGAQWIHGTHGNPLFEFASLNGLLHQDKLEGWPKFTRFNRIYKTSDGEDIPPNLVKELSVWYAKLIERYNSIYCTDLNSKTHENHTDTSVESAVKEELKKFLTQKPQKEHYIWQQIIEHKLAYETTLSGCDSMEEVSLSQFGSYVELKGPDPVVPGGFIKIVECLAADITEGCIRLNTPVRQINYKEAMTAGPNVEDEPQIEVQLESGQIEKFNHVIVTSSIKYLQTNHMSLFNPPLDEVKQHALSMHAMGTVDKIFLQFDNLDFLPSDCRMIMVAWPLDVDKEVWTSGLHGFSVINTPRQDTLIAWLTGQRAEAMEKLSDEEVKKGCMMVLSGILKNSQLPQPVNLIRTKWGEDAYICGSYSFIPVGGTVQDLIELSKPIVDFAGKPLIQFAGEGTHPEFYSTTHGALLSGQREAEALIQLYKN